MARMIFRSFLLFVCWIAPVLAYGAETVRPVKYVFLFIGDGMSIPQRMLAEEYLQRTERRGLRINAMPRLALTTTRSVDSFITDSAAGGTAIACGEKTDNGSLGVASDGRRLESVAERARKNGRKVGIITSVTLNHATPAAFYAHNASRGNAYDIGLDLIASGFDYFGGGGIAKNDDKKAKTYRGDLYELAREAGYTVCRTPEEFHALSSGSGNTEVGTGTGKVLSIGAKGALPYAIDKPDGLRLPDFTRHGIELLDNPNGFFIMVEGGAIDWACHANDAATAIRETLEFDEAVAVAVEFAGKHPEDTLIVVTADHETGGLTLGCNDTAYASYYELLANQNGSLDALGEAFKAFGKDRDIRTFDALQPLITEKTGLVFAKDGDRAKGGLNLTKSEEEELEGIFQHSLEDGRFTQGAALARAVIRILDTKAGVGWTSGAHTALPVSTTAQGSGSEEFTGMIDNTDIAEKLKEVVR